MSWSWVDPTRYYVSLVLWLTLPPAIVFWLVIHPLAGFWRRLGPVRTYAVMAVLMAGVGYLCWLARGPVMAKSYPVRGSSVVIGLVLYALAAWIEVRCRRHLKTRILVGVPELSATEPGQLLTEGIYAHTRNPRYLDLIIAMIGLSLITNYQIVYWLSMLSIAGLYAVTLLEERELRQRFGAPYERYLESVPRFLPRSWAFLTA